ncbi:MAG TPA: lipase maturation factor family protein [Polyangiaceae bacterium]|nr:lipase maturation factor family protein [Polyangiaceae bacterium]
MSSPVSPELVWGAFTRLVGVVYVIAFASMFGQIAALVGERGVVPVGLKLAAIRRDFPGVRRFLYFPSLLWLGHGDGALRSLVALGAVCGAGIVYGGPASFYWFALAYALFLSLDVALRLSFPWECVLFETGILALFLPATLPLPELAATHAPAPAIAWAYRILLFRVVFGFGKFKFVGSTKNDLTYLKGFLINQPLPSPIAWYASRLPMWALRLGMLSLFLVEIPGATLTLWPGPLGLVGGAGIVGLMIVINLSGNFGYFNWVVGFLCVPLLDWDTPRALDLRHAFSPGGPWLANAFVAAHTAGALLYLPFNSYVSQCWHRWTFWRRVRPAFLSLPVRALRAVQPSRWLHSYGVFPPKSMPGIRGVAVIEVSYDGETWHELEYTRAMTRPENAPRFIAPHMARWDQTIIYESYGTTEHALAYSVANSGMPYGHATFSDTECFLQRILEGERYEGVLLREGTLPRPEPPKLARMRTYLLRPATLEEHAKSGVWWTREVIGPHYPARARNDHFWQLWLPEPELFDFDDVVWKERTVLGSLMRSSDRDDDLVALVTRGAPDLSAADVDRFFDEFLPAAHASDPGNWASVGARVQALSSRFSALELRRFERVAGRLSTALDSRIEPLAAATKDGPLPTHYDVACLAQHLLLKGRAVVEDMLAHPERAQDRAGDLTPETSLYLSAMFRLDRLVWEAHKMRFLDMILVRSSERFPDSERARAERKLEETAKKIWGVARLSPFLRRQFKEPEYCDGTPERYPEFTEGPEGEILETTPQPV